MLDVKVEDGVAIVSIDQPGSKVNVLNSALFRALNELFQRAAGEREWKALILTSGKPGMFVAGADIEEIKNIHSMEEGRRLSREAQEVFQKLDDLSIPTLAAMPGVALGGGFELALATDYRLLADISSAQVGLPEVQLGVLPGAGGTQRLPRLVGLTSALDLILSGKRLRPNRALKAGLVDEVVPAELLMERAKQAAKELIAKNGPAQQKLSKRSRSGAKAWLEKLTPKGIIRNKVSGELQKKTRGHYPAPFKALEAVLGSTGGLKEGLLTEAELFGELAATSVSKSLIHIYEITTKNRGQADAMAKAHPWNARKIGVLGAGLMGSGITTVLASQGYTVRVKDQNEEALGRCLAYADRVYSKDVDRKRYRPFDKKLRLSRISPTVDYSGFRKADMVIEAVFEDLAVKHKVLAEVEENCHEKTIFATNTSAIPIKHIARAAKRPENVIGMHFFSPVEKMQLVEVITTPETAEWVKAATVALGKKMNTHVIVVNDGAGFYTSRVLAAYMAQAIRLYFEGAHADQIDQALVEFGFPVGPMVLMDEVGLDVATKVMSVMTEYLPSRFPAGEQMDQWKELFSDGRAGKKSGKGFYVYNGKEKEPDAALQEKATRGKPVRTITSREIQDRCVYAFLAECLHCLHENILLSEDDGDVGAIFGLGFPPFLGGPFHFMKTVGQSEVLRKLGDLEKQYGAAFNAPGQVLASAR